MDAIASCGVAKATRFPPRGTFLGRHVILPRPIGRLVFYDHQQSAFKVFTPFHSPYDAITFVIGSDVKKDNPFEDDVKTNEDSSSKRSSPRLSRPVVSKMKQLLAENAYDENAGDVVMKLRKPGVVYEDNHRRSLMKKKPASILRSEGVKNITLLQKPEVGKPYRTESRPDDLADQVPSDVSMIYQSYKPQKSKFELYLSHPIQVSLNPKPEVMTTKPDSAIPVPSIDKSLEERENKPETRYHSNPERPKLPPLMSNFTKQAASIDLRKPSIPTDNNKTDPKSEPKPNILPDMQIDSSLSSQPDQNFELELKPSLDKVRFNREDLRNVGIEGIGLSITDLRKPDVSLDDNAEMDPRPEKEPRQLLDEHRHDHSNNLSELNLKPKHESNTEMMARYSREDLSDVILHKKPKFDVGLQQTNQGTDGDKLIRNESSDAGSISSEEEDWKKLEKLLNTGERVIVELAGYTNEGFIATLDSIAGFIPYRNLRLRYKFHAFDSWLGMKGVDLTNYQQKVQNIDSTVSMDSLPDLGLDAKTLEQNQQIGEAVNSNSTLNFGGLFVEYQREKESFLSSFIGQKLKVRVSMADKSSKRIIFTGKHKEHQELLKKRKLMARLKIGDIVKCRIYRFTHFGIFVKVEGVSALIPAEEVLCEGTLDLLFSHKLGQILDARVHNLDYKRERITLSLKGVTPDPQNNDFESVIAGDMSFSGILQAAQPEEEWEDVESLIKELNKLEEVDTISKGTFFLSTGLAPTFQVYMAPMVDDRYRLLARFGNKVQEVLIQASMDEEKMKSAILACTSRIT
ncbi:hypothetical protein FCM35_KLT13141 [Carex littledalei]|uniref:S1 motif domain-containing protein n=1 Tax=Carex littledalei TaxID=544730 RepID=A0A833QJU3_9POAL|nr:hypothetical protein FCM35_KLT13141 [Carex littledalei]